MVFSIFCSCRSHSGKNMMPTSFDSWKGYLKKNIQYKKVVHTIQLGFLIWNSCACKFCHRASEVEWCTDRCWIYVPHARFLSKMAQNDAKRTLHNIKPLFDSVFVYVGARVLSNIFCAAMHHPFNQSISCPSSRYLATFWNLLPT